MYAFDQRRNAILLLGGVKTGNDDWYPENVPIAEKILDWHMAQVEKEEKEKAKKKKR